MKRGTYILENEDFQETDKWDDRDFTIHFQEAILLSLLESRKLTQSQYEACRNKVVQKYSSGL